MQLSLSSFPGDPGVSAPRGSNATPDANTGADPAAAGMPIGFGQLLAALAPAPAPQSGAPMDLLAGGSAPTGIDLLNSPLGVPAPGAPSVVPGAPSALVDPGVLSVAFGATRAPAGTASPGGPPMCGAPKAGKVAKADANPAPALADVQAFALAAMGQPPPVVAEAANPKADGDPASVAVNDPFSAAGTKSGRVLLPISLRAYAAGAAGVGAPGVGGTPGPMPSHESDPANAPLGEGAATPKGAGPTTAMPTTLSNPCNKDPGTFSLPALDGEATRAGVPVPSPSGSAAVTPDATTPAAASSGLPAISGAEAVKVQPDPAVLTAAAARTSAEPSVASPTTAMENIAAMNSQLPGSGPAGEKAAVKRFVATDAKGVTQSQRPFGISGAGSAPTMPAGPTFAHSNTSESAPVTATAAASEAPPQPASLPQSVALTSTAHRAVEAVLSVTDRFAAREQHSVNLQFSVAGSDLNVRVELRAGEVHTTFRTDSSELRAALSGEWHTMTTQGNSDRSTRLAPPVFTASEQSGTSFSGGNASPHHRGTDARGSGESSSSLTVPRRGAESTGTAHSSAAATPATRNTSVNSVHLHTLA
jgi:hypothetical protein